MAPSSILKNGLKSPVQNVVKTGATRSILRRPTALPMSPQAFPIAATFSFSLKSPHVHFPSSPTLAATFSTYGSSYDRTAIPVSPNPLALPAWGTPIFSPSLRGFKLAAPPKPFRSITYQASPAIEDFEDPRSPQLQPTGRSRTIRFAPFPTADQVLAPKAKAPNPLATYPRSPYPTAPLESTEASESKKEQIKQPEPFKRNKKGLSLAARRNSGFPSISSPLNQSFTPNFTPKSTLNRINKPAPLDLNPSENELVDDFWKSVSLEPGSADEVMVTALEYPQSAVNYEAHHANELRSATAPQLIYAGGDGVPVWSPAVPKPGTAANKIRESLMSPAPQRLRAVARREITAPSPNDPFAAFPSFAVALSQGVVDGSIQYPPRVLQRG